MNWKNISIEPGFIKQELNLNGSKVVNYIPLNQVDSFGVVSSENKRWLYAAIFFVCLAVVMGASQEFKTMTFMGVIAAGLVGYYLQTRQTWLTITSSHAKFSVQVMTTNEEIQAVNSFVMNIKKSIYESEMSVHKIAA